MSSLQRGSRLVRYLGLFFLFLSFVMGGCSGTQTPGSGGPLGNTGPSAPREGTPPVTGGAPSPPSAAGPLPSLQAPTDPVAESSPLNPLPADDSHFSETSPTSPTPSVPLPSATSEGLPQSPSQPQLTDGHEQQAPASGSGHFAQTQNLPVFRLPEVNVGLGAAILGGTSDPFSLSHWAGYAGTLSGQFRFEGAILAGQIRLDLGFNSGVIPFAALQVEGLSLRYPISAVMGVYTGVSPLNGEMLVGTSQAFENRGAWIPSGFIGLLRRVNHDCELRIFAQTGAAVGRHETSMDSVGSLAVGSDITLDCSKIQIQAIYTMLTSFQGDYTHRVTSQVEWDFQRYQRIDAQHTIGTRCLGEFTSCGLVARFLGNFNTLTQNGDNRFQDGSYLFNLGLQIGF